MRALAFACTFLSLLVYCFSIQSVQFAPVKDASTASVVYLTNEYPIVSIDATSAVSRMVYFAERSSYMEQIFTFACHVNQQASPLKSISLCCRKDQNTPEKRCHAISETQTSRKFSCLKTEFTFTVDWFSGAKFSIKIGKQQVLNYALSGLFSCSVTDSAQTTIISNEFEIRDAVFYVHQLPTDTSNAITVVNPIDKGSFPYSFECNPQIFTRDWPSWMHTLSDSFGVYQWNYCTVNERLNALSCTKRRQPLSRDVAISFLNGTVFVLDYQFFEMANRALLCKGKERNAPISTFAGAVQKLEVPVITNGISLGTTSHFPPHLQPLSELNQVYSMVSESNLNGFSLNALYQETAGGSSFQWRKDNEPLLVKDATKFSYKLPSTVDIKMDGLYTLTVTSNDDPKDILVFSYKLEVVYPPNFIEPECLSGLFLLMRGTNFSTTCSFLSKSPPKTLVSVNQYDATTPEELRSMLEKDILSNPMLTKLAIDFHITKEKSFDVSIISIQIGQDFELGIRLESPYGDSHISSSLKVVPIPKLQNVPQSSSCLQDCDERPYNVSCSLDPDLVLLWKDGFEITPAVSWIIQNQWVSTAFDPAGIGRFASVSNTDGSVLSIWPQGNPDSKLTEEQDTNEPQSTTAEAKNLKQFIAENSVTGDTEELSLRCRIQLFVHDATVHFKPPPELVLRRGARQQLSNSLSSDARLIYDSTWEPDHALASQLIASRAFTPSAPAAAANLSWIAAVVIGILIVLIVVILGIWLRFRDRGETYMLYAKEREHGNDPIQEIKDTEGFKTYQRQEEQPIACSQYSLHADSMHLASDEEGEMEEYGENFNEDASYIGQYKADSAVPRASLTHPDTTVAGTRNSGTNQHTDV